MAREIFDPIEDDNDETASVEAAQTTPQVEQPQQTEQERQNDDPFGHLRTKLLGDDTDKFLNWARTLPPNLQQNVNYDLEGYWIERGRPDVAEEDEASHMSNRHNLPNHPMFSTDSRFSTDEHMGGRWFTDKDGKAHFMPSKFSVNALSFDNIKKFFDERKLDVALDNPYADEDGKYSHTDRLKDTYTAKSGRDVGAAEAYARGIVPFADKVVSFYDEEKLRKLEKLRSGEAFNYVKDVLDAVKKEEDEDAKWEALGAFDGPGGRELKEKKRKIREQAIAGLGNHMGASSQMAMVAEDAGIPSERIQQISESSKTFGDFARNLQTEATGLLKRQAEAKRDAQMRMEVNKANAWDKIVNGALTNVGYTGEYIAAAAAGAVGMPLLVGASTASRMSELNTNQYAVDPVTGELLVRHSAENDVGTFGKALAGGVAEVAVEKFGGELLNKGLGLAFKGIARTGVGQAIGRGAGKLSTKVIGEDATHAVVGYGKNAVSQFRRFGEVSGVHGIPGEQFEETVQAFFDDAVGLGGRSVDGAVFDLDAFGKRLKEYRKNTLSWNGQAEIFLGLLGTIAGQGGIALGSAIHNDVKTAKAFDAYMNDHYGAQDPELVKAYNALPRYVRREFFNFITSPEVTQTSVRAFLDNLSVSAKTRANLATLRDVEAPFFDSMDASGRYGGDYGGDVVTNVMNGNGDSNVKSQYQYNPENTHEVRQVKDTKAAKAGAKYRENYDENTGISIQDFGEIDAGNGGNGGKTAYVNVQNKDGFNYQILVDDETVDAYNREHKTNLTKGEFANEIAVNTAHRMSVHNQLLDAKRQMKLDYIRKRLQAVANAVNVRVYNTMQECLAENPALRNTRDFNMENKALHDADGTVTLIVDNLRSAFDVDDAIMHEAAVHEGLDRVFGGVHNGKKIKDMTPDERAEWRRSDDYRKMVAQKVDFLSRVTDPRMAARMERFARHAGLAALNDPKYYQSLCADTSREGQGKRRLFEVYVEEVFAHSIENVRVNRGNYSRFRHWVRDKIRSAGVRIGYDESDVDAMVESLQRSIVDSVSHGDPFFINGQNVGKQGRKVAYIDGIAAQYPNLFAAAMKLKNGDRIEAARYVVDSINAVRRNGGTANDLENAVGEMNNPTDQGKAYDRAKRKMARKNGAGTDEKVEENDPRTILGEEQKNYEDEKLEQIKRDGYKAWVESETRRKVSEKGKEATEEAPSGNVEDNAEHDEPPAPPPANTGMKPTLLRGTDGKAVEISEVPVDEIHLSDDIPNFKIDADAKTGIVRNEAIQGETYDRDPINPIYVMRRKNGRLEVITGRHRLEYAKRIGEKTIPAQIVDEADSGVGSIEWARTVDARSNIRDGNGSVADYVNYMTQGKITREQAERNGWFKKTNNNPKAFQAATLVFNAIPEVRAAWRDGDITAGQAAAISSATDDENRQRVLMNHCMKFPRTKESDIRNILLDMEQRHKPKSGGAEQLDIFVTYDPSWAEEADRRNKAANKIQKRLVNERRVLNNVKGMSREAAAQTLKQNGIEVSADRDAVNGRLEVLNDEVERWKNWPQHRDLIGQVDAEVEGETVKKETPQKPSNPSPAAPKEKASKEETVKKETPQKPSKAGKAKPLPRRIETSAEEDAALDAFDDIKWSSVEVEESDNDVRWSAVTEDDVRRELGIKPGEKIKTIKTYRAVVLHNNRLYPPMASKIGDDAKGKNRQWNDSTSAAIGDWVKADERPDLAYQKENGKWYFKLLKSNDESVEAAYNPYLHTSFSPLNDQFKSAQDREDIVIVEMEIPVSDIESGYHAKKAKDPVGVKEWPAGVLTRSLKNGRKVVLSRFGKISRIVPYSEIAGHVQKTFAEDQVFPSNVVHPELRRELEKLGRRFVDTDNDGYPLGTAAMKLAGSDIKTTDLVQWHGKVERALEGGLKDTVAVDILPKTTKIINTVLKQNFGRRKNTPIKTNASVIRKIVEDKHGMSKEDVKNLPFLLDDPIAVFKSSTHPDSSIVVLVNAVDKQSGNEAIVALKYATEDGSKQLSLVFATSMYGKPETTIRRWFDEGMHLYVNKQKVHSYFRSSPPLQLRQGGNKNGHSYLTEEDFPQLFGKSVANSSEDGNEVRWSSRELSDEQYSKLTIASRNLVKAMVKNGHRTFGDFVTLLHDKKPEVYERVKDFLRRQWNGIAEDYDGEIEEVSRQEANDVFARVEAVEDASDAKTDDSEESKTDTKEETPEETDDAVDGEDADEKTVAEGKDQSILNAGMEIAAWLRQGKTLTNADVAKIAEKHYGESMTSGKITVKDARNLLELGVNLYIEELSSVKTALESGKVEDAVKAVKDIREKVLAHIPTETSRTTEQLAAQQFSTPPTEAFLAAWVARIGKGEVMLEPSAGIGGLAVFAKMNGAEVVLNEYMPRRAQVLQQLGATRHGIMDHDAGNMNAMYQLDMRNGKAPARPTVVVMNPPFSANVRTGKKDSVGVGGRHVEEALKLLQPGGRLVAIVGNALDSKDGSQSGMEWLKRIGSEYAIRANVQVNGKEYAKYGTTFDNNLLVIDKTAPDGRTLTGRGESVEQLLEMLSGVRDGRAAVATPKNPANSGTKGVKPPSTKPFGGKAKTPAPKSNVGEGHTFHKPANCVKVKFSYTNRTGASGAVVDNGERVTDATVGMARAAMVAWSSVNLEDEEMEMKADSLAPVVAYLKNDGKATFHEFCRVCRQGKPEKFEKFRDYFGRIWNTIAATDPDIPRVTADEITNTLAEVEKMKVGKVSSEVGDGTFAEYEPSNVAQNSRTHITPLVESAAMASVQTPKVTYELDLDADVVRSGQPSGAQLEAMGLACQAMEREITDENGNKVRGGFLLGDGTGCGKGTMISGIISNYFNKGKIRKAVWFAPNSPLFKDAVRDMTTYGNQDLMFEFKKDSKGVMNRSCGVAFCTYGSVASSTTIGSDEHGKTVLKRKDERKTSYMLELAKWLGRDYDGLIVLDESHMVSNVQGKRGKRGQTNGSDGANIMREWVRMFPKARVLYVSATSATEASDMAYLERLGLWGVGTSFSNAGAFVGALNNQGLAVMEVVARDMKAMGVYIARTLSMQGVVNRTLVHDMTEDETADYDRVVKVWQNVRKHFKTALHETGGDRGGARTMSQFYGRQQEFFNQYLVGIKMKTVIADAQKALKRGECPVFQIVNTRAAALARQEAEAAANGEELDADSIDLSPKDILVNLVRDSYPTVMYHEEQDGERTRMVMTVDDEGNPVEDPEMIERRDNLIADLQSISMGVNAIDAIIDTFGVENVAEITGRTKRYVQKKGKSEKTVETRTKADLDREAQDFNDGKRRILVFSKSGGTGRSFHADKRFANHAKRQHYLIQAGWRAADAVQGFGRTLRTNQAQAPEYVLCTTNVEGEKRFLSSIARRLNQMGSLTAGDRSASGSGILSEDMNLENKYANEAVSLVFNDHFTHMRGSFDEFCDSLGFATYDENGDPHSNLIDPKNPANLDTKKIPDATRFLNRILCTGIDEQADLFREFFNAIRSATETAKAEGRYDSGTQELKALKTTIESRDNLWTDENGQRLDVVTVNAEQAAKKMTFENVLRQMAWTRPTGWNEAKFNEDYNFFVIDNSNGKIYGVGRASDSTVGGNVTERYVMFPINYSRRLMRDVREVDGNPARFRVLSRKEAEESWNAQYDLEHDTVSEKMHFAAGVMLPKWNVLAEEDGKEIYRVRDSGTGEKFIGLKIDESRLDTVYSMFGKSVKGEAKSYAPLDVQNDILNNGARYETVDGKTLSRRLLRNQYFIKMVMPGFTERKMRDLELDGLVSVERTVKGWEMFIPYDSNNRFKADGMVKFLSRFPLKVDDGGPDGGTRWSSRELDDAARREYDDVVARYTNRDGTRKPGWMKAPNGRATNLTERQWVQVRTPSFKKWFGDWEAILRNNLLNNAKVTHIKQNAIVKNDSGTARDSAIAWWGDRPPVSVDTEVGTIIADKRTIHDSLSHGYAQGKLDAVSSLPDGLKNAVYLTSAPDFTRPGTMAHYFAYPAEYNGRRQLVFLRAKEDVNLNRFYVHEMFDEADLMTSWHENAQSDATSNQGIDQVLRKSDEALMHSGGIALYKRILQSVLAVNPESVSKVVDDNGEPRVVYHGTKRGRFTAFNEAKDGIYFTDSAEAAEYYGWGEHDSVFDVFLNMSNPLEVDYSDEENDLGIPDEVAAAREDGFDGVVVRNSFDGENTMDQYVVLKPNQIKSATDNAGAFSNDENDIRWSSSVISDMEKDVANGRLYSAVNRAVRPFDGMTVADIETINRWRSDRGLYSVKKPAKKTLQRIHEEGMRLGSNTVEMERLAQVGARTPLNLKDSEVSALLEHVRKLENEYDAKTNEMNVAVAEGNTESAKLIYAQRGLILSSINTTHTALRRAAAEWGRAGLARRMLKKVTDGSYAGLKYDVEAEVGHKLSDIEDEQLKQLYNALKEANGELTQEIVDRVKDIIHNEFRKIVVEGNKHRVMDDKSLAQVEKDYNHALDAIRVHSHRGGGVLLGLPGGKKWIDALRRYHTAVALLAGHKITVEDVIARIHEDVDPYVSATDWDIEQMVTGYGNTSEMPQSELERQLREQRSLMRAMQKMQDILNGAPARLTGTIPDKESLAVREANRKVREAMAELYAAHPELFKGDGRLRMKAIQESIKRRFENEIEEIQKALDTGKRIDRTTNKVTYTPEMQEIHKHLEEMRELYRQTFVTQEEEDEKKRMRIRRALANRLDKLNAKRDAYEVARQNGDVAEMERILSTAKKERLTDGDIEDLRRQIAETKADMAEMEAEDFPEGTPEKLAKKLEARIASLEGAIAAKEDQIMRNDILPKKREKSALLSRVESDPRVIALTKKRNQANRRIREMRNELVIRNHPLNVLGILEKGSALYHAFKTIKAAYDISAVGRQGALAMGAHPVIGTKALVASVKAMFSEAEADRLTQELMHTPEWEEYLVHGGELANTSDLMDDSTMPELFKSMETRPFSFNGRKIGIADLPGIRQSERSYGMFLNCMKVMMYRQLKESGAWGSTGPSTEQKKDLVEHLEVLTGTGYNQRGQGNAMSMFADFALWAPKLLAASIRNALMIDPVIIALKNRASKDEYSMKQRLRTIAVLQGHQMRAYAGALILTAIVTMLFGRRDPEWLDNILSANGTEFLSPRVGNTNVGFFSNITGVWTLLARLRTGTARGVDGVERRKDRDQVIGRFVRGKASPLAGTLYDLLRGDTFDGRAIKLDANGEKEVNVWRHILENLVMPLTVPDAIETIEGNDDLWTGVTLAALAVPTGWARHTIADVDDVSMVNRYRANASEYRKAVKEGRTEDARTLLAKHPEIAREKAIGRQINAVRKLEKQIGELTASGKTPGENVMENYRRSREAMLNAIRDARGTTAE